MQEQIHDPSKANSLVITTTAIHPPRRISDPVHLAVKSDQEIHYHEEGYFARSQWRREE